MPVGPYPTFAACTIAVRAQYAKSHPTWSSEQLDKVAGAVCGQMEKQTSQGLTVAYQAKFEPYSVDERHFVKVYNVDDSWNGNGWAVTPQARKDSLTSFFRQPLLGPEHLSRHHIIDTNPKHPHYGTWAVIGKPVDVINNGQTYGIYEVTVPEAWDMIQAGELGPVSPSVKILAEEEQADGRKLITKFEWDHTLFVDCPAFPKAGVVATCTAADSSLCSFAQSLQSFAQAAENAWIAQAELIRHDYEEFCRLMKAKGLTQEEIDKAWSEHLRSHKSQGESRDKDDAGYSPERAGNPTDRKTDDSTGGGILENSINALAQAADAWSTADAPDKFFAYVPESAKGPDGNKSERKLPLASVQKKGLDEAIIKNALARLPQTEGVDKAAAKAKICSAANSLGLDLPSCKTGQGQQGEPNMPDTPVKDESGCKEAQAKMTSDLAQATQKIKDLEARLQARDEAELAEAALGVVSLEVQAGLVKEDKTTERIAELKKLGAPALKEMQGRFKQLVEKVQAAKAPREPHALKADFDEALKDPAQASSIMEQIRQASVGISRTPEDVAKLEKTISWVK
jgi:hypothetical protein